MPVMDQAVSLNINILLFFPTSRIFWNRRNTVQVKDRRLINIGDNLRLRVHDGTFVNYRLHAAVEHLGLANR